MHGWGGGGSQSVDITDAGKRGGGNSSKFDKILIDLKNTTTFSVWKAVKVRAFLHKSPNFSTENLSEEKWKRQ